MTGLATAVTAASFEALDGDTGELVCQRVLDTLGAVVAGGGTEAADALRNLQADLAGAAANASPAGHRGRTRTAASTGCRGLLDEVRRLCAAARASEVDDIDPASCTTAGCVAVPVALLVGAARGADDRLVLGGIVAGYEAMTRVGAAIDGAHRVYAGVWPSLLVAPLGAAAAAARVLALDPAATAHALAIAAARAGGSAGRVVGEPTSRWLLFGCAAADGVVAALAAGRGMLGDPTGLEVALRRTADGDLDMSVLSDPPAERSPIAEVDVKPFCTARQVHAAVEAAQRARDRLPPGDLEAVTVAVPGQYRGMIDRPEPVDRLGSIASTQYQVAMALAHPAALYDVARTSLYGDPTARELMGRITVVEAADLTALYPHRWAARVRLRSTSGDEAECEVREPLGSASRPLGWGGLLDKHAAIGRWGDALGRAMEHCRRIGEEPAATHAAAALALAMPRDGE